MNDRAVYIVAGSRPWNRKVFEEAIRSLPGEWHFVAAPVELKADWVRRIDPRYLFFLHWSWKVSREIYAPYECVCFHMANVPYGRGGSPLQNLILRGHRTTKLTALRMVEEMDAGPVYLKEELSLEGSAEEIYIRATYLSAKMIERIIGSRVEPVPQEGEPTVFRRRRPHESRLPEGGSPVELYDFIRMLDAEEYPRAYLDCGAFRLEFSEAVFSEGRLTARVTFLPSEPLS